LFVAQVRALFLEPSSPDYWLRIRRWARASAAAYDSLPHDDDVAAFYALSLLATAPSDTMSRANADRAAEILLALHERNPGHPGAMHYLVHANDVSGREHQSLDVTHDYETVAPDNPHALHMPTHIYTRLGDWTGVVRGNLRAAAAALRYPAGDSGQFVSDEFPHAIEYLVYAYLQTGADSDASAQVARLRSTGHLEPTFKTAFHLMSTQSRLALEQHDWRAAMIIVPREPATLDWDRFAWAEAVAQFARGLGAAHLGDTAVAALSNARLEVLEGKMVAAGEDLFARNIRELRLELTSWRTHVEGRSDASVALMQAAIDLELTTPKHAVTPAPTLPAEELMGDLLMDMRRPGAALASYEASVAHYPRRLNGLLGAARAARVLDDSTRARSYYRQALEVAATNSHRVELAEARRYTDGAP
jgi:tetratricopeptide (TPR) repeat protein